MFVERASRASTVASAALLLLQGLAGCGALEPAATITATKTPADIANDGVPRCIQEALSPSDLAGQFRAFRFVLEWGDASALLPGNEESGWNPILRVGHESNADRHQPGSMADFTNLLRVLLNDPALHAPDFEVDTTALRQDRPREIQYDLSDHIWLSVRETIQPADAEMAEELHQNPDRVPFGALRSPIPSDLTVIVVQDDTCNSDNGCDQDHSRLSRTLAPEFDLLVERLASWLGGNTTTFELYKSLCGPQPRAE